MLHKNLYVVLFDTCFPDDEPLWFETCKNIQCYNINI